MSDNRSPRKRVTVCECGLAKCYHEGTNPLAYRKSFNGTPPVCKGYKPREEDWWKKEPVDVG